MAIFWVAITHICPKIYSQPAQLKKDYFCLSILISGYTALRWPCTQLKHKWTQPQVQKDNFDLKLESIDFYIYCSRKKTNWKSGLFKLHFKCYVLYIYIYLHCNYSIILYKIINFMFMYKKIKLALLAMNELFWYKPLLTNENYQSKTFVAT